MFLDPRTYPPTLTPAVTGAAGNGTTDDRPAFAATDTGGGTIYVPPGTYRISAPSGGSTFTINSDIRFQQGAVLKPDANVTVVLTGRVDAGPFQIFDVSASGSNAYPRRESQFVPQWWGATGNGTTDDYPAIAAMLNAARQYAGGARKPTTTEIEPAALATPVLFFPNGIYRVTTPLNCTSGDPAYVTPPSFYTLRGCGMRRSVIRGDTGGSNAIIELVGASYSIVEGLTLEVSRNTDGSRATNASGTGILLGRTKDASGYASQSWFVNIRDVEVVMGTSTTANAGKGTVGIYNYCCEVSDIHNVYSQADNGLVFTIANELSLASVHRPSTAQYGMITSVTQGASMTACTVTGNNMLLGGRGPAVLLSGAANIYIQAHVTRQTVPSPGVSYLYAIDVVGQVTDVEYRGSVEVFERVLRTISQIRGLRLHAYAPYVPSHPRVYLDQDPNGNQFAYVDDSIIDVVPNPVSYDPSHSPLDVEGYVIDSTSAWPNAVRGSLVFLREGKARLQNTSQWSFFNNNLVLSNKSLSSGVVSATNRAGNTIHAADGWEVDDKLALRTTATGTTLGSVVRKVQVFDAAGTSLGFVPVYNSIT
jgi:hypothetical protein